MLFFILSEATDGSWSGTFTAGFILGFIVCVILIIAIAAWEERHSKAHATQTPPQPLPKAQVADPFTLQPPPQPTPVQPPPAQPSTISPLPWESLITPKPIDPAPRKQVSDRSAQHTGLQSAQCSPAPKAAAPLASNGIRVSTGKSNGMPL